MKLPGKLEVYIILSNPCLPGRSFTVSPTNTKGPFVVVQLSPQKYTNIVFYLKYIGTKSWLCKGLSYSNMFLSALKIFSFKASNVHIYFHRKKLVKICFQRHFALVTKFIAKFYYGRLVYRNICFLYNYKILSTRNKKRR